MSRICYVDDSLPGITRKRRGRYWQYFDPKGARVTDRDEIDRLNAIGLPPAYGDAWFCPSPHGHIQAIGYDDRGRKQYRYHVDFRAAQDAAKYDRCADFGRALPLIRARVESDLAVSGIGHDKAVAAVVRLLDLGHVRVGNADYAKANKSFGATTLLNRHAAIRRGRLKLEFRGKSGKMQQLTIEDRRLAQVVKRCQDLPGQQLFQYLDEEDERHAVTSTDVNAYIREAAGDDFTAKHFRTWGASVIAFDMLCAAKEAGVSVNALLEPVAEALGNTPAISRKSYVHPALIEHAKLAADCSCLPRPRRTRYLSAAERGLIEYLDLLAQGAPAKAA